MTPLQHIQARHARLSLVIFDCDGVLVDSEPISNGIIADELTQAGWPMTAHEAAQHFLGMVWPDMEPVIAARLGRPVQTVWKHAVMQRILAELSTSARAIPGAVEALQAATDLGLPWRIASNSSHEEMQAKFGRLGIADIVQGRVHSHRDVARAKPAPDLFLAAAAAEGVTPQSCLVIEDSLTGMRAAAAAGMECLAYVPHGTVDAATALGAWPFQSMFELPALFKAALQVIA